MKYLLLLSVLLCSCSTLKNWGVSGVKEENPIFFPIWIKNQDPTYRSGNLPISLQAPTLDGGLLFIGDENGVMRAFQATDGREIWSIQDKGAHQAQVIVHNQHIIYGTIEGRLYARHRLSGKLKYEVALGAAVEAAPVMAKGRVFVHTRNHQIFCLDAETGKILWAYKRSVPFLTTLQGVSTPLVQGNRVFVGFADGSLVALSMEEGILAWESKVVNGQKFIDADTGPVLFNGKLFIGSQANQLASVNPATGFIERRFPYTMTARPIVHGEVMIFGTADGEIIAFNKEFSEIRKIKASDFAISSLVKWKGGLVVGGTGGKVKWFDLNQNWELGGSWHLGHSYSAIFDEMDASEEHLAIYSNRNRLYVFQ